MPRNYVKVEDRQIKPLWREILDSIEAQEGEALNVPDLIVLERELRARGILNGPGSLTRCKTRDDLWRVLGVKGYGDSPRTRSDRA